MKIIITFTFILLSFSVSSQNVSIADNTSHHRCCTRSFDTVDDDGLPERIGVTSCREVKGNDVGASQEAYEEACALAGARLAIVRRKEGL
jgi:hypothetical protein